MADSHLSMISSRGARMLRFRVNDPDAPVQRPMTKLQASWSACGSHSASRSFDAWLMAYVNQGLMA